MKVLLRNEKVIMFTGKCLLHEVYYAISYPVVAMSNKLGSELLKYIINQHLWIYWTTPVSEVQNVPAC